MRKFSGLFNLHSAWPGIGGTVSGMGIKKASKKKKPKAVEAFAFVEDGEISIDGMAHRRCDLGWQIAPGFDSYVTRVRITPISKPRKSRGKR